ncbi:MAG: aminotransferase class IV [Gemmobacter sp.]
MESAFRQGDLDDPALRLPDLRLIETLGWDGAAFARLPLHLARLAESAARLGWTCDPDRAARALRQAAPAAPARMRLTLDAGGALAVTASPMPAPAPLWRVTLADERLDPADPWLALKSTRRAAYDRARAALPAGIDEAILANPRGEVCDGTITTVFFDAGDGLCAPPLSAGLLPGVLRAEMLAGGKCREATLHLNDLPHVRLWVGNSLRGLIPAVWAAP